MPEPVISISTDPARLDVGLIHRFLNTSYWAQGRPREILVRAMLDHPDLSDVRVVMLRTRDAQGLYRQFGFTEIPEAGEVMALYRSAF